MGGRTWVAGPQESHKETIGKIITNHINSQQNRNKNHSHIFYQIHASNRIITIGSVRHNKTIKVTQAGFSSTCMPAPGTLRYYQQVGATALCCKYLLCLKRPLPTTSASNQASRAQRLCRHLREPGCDRQLMANHTKYLKQISLVGASAFGLALCLAPTPGCLSKSM